ncbi:MAG: hypothetical protein ACR2IK_12985 [Chloroflexota bacterium]
MQQPSATTTVRVSRRTHKVLSEIAARQGRSVAELLDQLAEQARRQQILAQSAARMVEILSDPEVRSHYLEELLLSEAAAAEVTSQEPPYDDARSHA